MKRYAILGTALVCALLAGCAMGPSYPDPSPNSGQVLVHLQGQPREGVGGPATRTEVAEYSLVRRSVEEGDQYQRVDYDALEDVVVVLRRTDGGRFIGQLHTEAWRNADLDSWDPRVHLRAGERGFDHTQRIGYEPDDEGPSLVVSNARAEALDLYFISAAGEVFELAVAAGASAGIRLAAGTYEVECDQQDQLYCTVYLLDKEAGWIGSSRYSAFFDTLPPGRYEVTVYPPRLPSWSSAVDVAAGERAVVTAPLTVNELPRLDR